MFLMKMYEFDKSAFVKKNIYEFSFWNLSIVFTYNPKFLFLLVGGRCFENLEIKFYIAM